MVRKRYLGAVAAALLLAGSSTPQAHAANLNNRNKIQRVLLLSIDGMHALDYLNCAAGLPNVKGTDGIDGHTYCPNLKALGNTGVNYLDTSTSKPSDSFPGLMALVTGGSPRTMGVNYDVAYDRALYPPTDTHCSGPVGTITKYDESIDLDSTTLNGGAGDGGIISLDPNRMVRDKNNSCNPVYPWNFVRENTIFGVIHGAKGYTAWSDKHPSYSSVAGPGDGTNLDDYYSPEINSDSSNFASEAPPQLVLPACSSDGSPTLPDQYAATAHDDYTASFLNIQCYDGLKVNAILNEIDGENHTGTAGAPVPNIFGMNFQAVSIGQKLIYQYNGGMTPQPVPAVNPPYSNSGGYTDSIGTPSTSLQYEIEFADASIGQMVAELKRQGLIGSTLIIVTAKHGQSPVDTSQYVRSGSSSNDPAKILGSCVLGSSEDDVSLLWLDQTMMGCDTANAVATLKGAPIGLGEIYSGPSIGLYWNIGDSRTPDILVTPNVGVTYSNSPKKLAEHGGFAHDDVNVIMLVSNPSFAPVTVTTPVLVQTAQVAPTILKALGLNPASLQAVVAQGTPVLPNLPF
jgi:hypothetical protein